MLDKMIEILIVEKRKISNMGLFDKFKKMKNLFQNRIMNMIKNMVLYLIYLIRK